MKRTSNPSNSPYLFHLMEFFFYLKYIQSKLLNGGKIRLKNIWTILADLLSAILFSASGSLSTPRGEHMTPADQCMHDQSQATMIAFFFAVDISATYLDTKRLP